MKTIKQILLATLFLTLIIITSCSKDNDNTPTINATNFSTTVDENPEGNSSLGTVSATTGTGTLTYTITSQIPSGAMSINSITGELKVANASLFDFETNPNIDAVITISSTEATTTVNATINLNNIDDITSFLSISKTAYINANNGDWIQITSSEYNTLATNLNEVTKAGTTDAEYSNTITADGASNYTRSNITTNAIIPNNGYVFAFKYSVSLVENSITGFKVKQSSTANNTGFYDLGNTLPTHSTSILPTDFFFVLKGNSTALPATGYLAIYNTASISLITDANSSGVAYFIAGDAQTISGTHFSHRPLYQGLVSTQKQWD